MTDQETKEEMPLPKHFEQQEPVEQPAPVVQTMKKTVPPVKEKKTMLSLEDRMKEFRDMMLERGVGVHVDVRGLIHNTTLLFKRPWTLTTKSHS